MKINKDSWHYKLWCATYNRESVPESTDLCRYCHRIFWRLVLWAFLIAASLFLIGMLGYAILYQGLYLHPLTTLITTVVAGVILTSIFWYTNWMDNRAAPTEPSTLLGKYARASKQKVCPLIEFEE